MKRSLCVFTIGLALSASLLAADAPKNGNVPPSPSPAPRAPRAISGRAQLETLLQSPAKLDFEARNRVSVREILDKLHEKHRLSLRFDSPTLAALLEKSQSSSSYHPGQVASGLGSLPLGLISSYSAAPVCCSPAGAYLSGAPVCSAPGCVGHAWAPVQAPPASTWPSVNYRSKEPIAQVSAYEASPADAEEASSGAPAPAAPAPAATTVDPALPVPPLNAAAGPALPVPALAPAASVGPATAATAVAPAAPLPPANAAVGRAALPPVKPPVLKGHVYDPTVTASAPGLVATVPNQLREAKQLPGNEPRKKRLEEAADRLREKLEQAEQESEDTPVGLPAGPGTTDPPKAEPTPPSTTAGSAQSSTSELLQTIDELLETEVDVQTLDLSSVSIATILRHALDAVPTTNGDDFAGMPILVTNASLLDYLVEDDGLLITSRMKALSKRETRVYSLKQLSDIPPEQLAKTIRQSIRPWSWRSQINDLGDQLKGTPLPAETMTSLLKSGVQLISAEAGMEVTPSEEPEAKPANAANDAKQMEMLGGAISNGLVTLAHSTLLVMEMMHYAEPPTATIQTLGNKLIVTQSQAAHREIAELLKQLSDE